MRTLKSISLFPIASIVFLCISQRGYSQTLFVADSAPANSVFKFTSGGAKSTFVSGLDSPTGLAFDGNGNLFVSNASYNPAKSQYSVGGGTIDKISPSGVITTFASDLTEPTKMAFDSNGNLFVSVDNNNFSNAGVILKFNPAGVQSTFASGFSQPAGLAFDRSGNLFVGEFDTGSIIKFTSGGVKSIFASGLGEVNDLAFDSSGNLFATDDSFGSILKFTAAGVQSTFASGLNSPIGIAIDGNDNIFADSFSGDIFKFTPTGVKSTFASGLTLPETLAFSTVPEPGPIALVLGAAVPGAAFLFRRLRLRSRRQIKTCA